MCFYGTGIWGADAIRNIHPSAVSRSIIRPILCLAILSCCLHFSVYRAQMVTRIW